MKNYIRKIDFTIRHMLRSFAHFNSTMNHLNWINLMTSSLIKKLDRYYASEWFGSIRFRFGFCWVEFLPDWNRHSAGSIRFGSGFFRFRLKRQKIQKLLRLSWRCVANKYIYMHLLYVACARDEKKFFFCENYRARS